MADYRYAVGTVARRTTTGVQTVTGISDALGLFTGKAVLLYGTVQASDGFTSNAYMFTGVSDGLTEFSCGCWANTGDSSPSIAWTNLITNPSLLTIPQEATQTTTAYSANNVVFAEGSFSFTWSASADTDPFDLHYVVFGGNDLFAEVGIAIDPVTTPAPVTTTLGMARQITALLTLGVPGTGSQVYAIPINTTDPWPNVGLANAALDQGIVASSIGPAGIGNSTGYSYQNNANVQAKLSGSRNASLSTLGALTDLGVGTLTVDYSAADGASGFSDPAGFIYLAIAGPQVVVGSTNSPTAAAPQTQTLTAGFTAGAMLAATIGLASSGSVQNNLGFSFGAATPLATANVWIGSLQGQADSSTSRGRFTDRLLTMAAPAVAEGQTVVATGAAVFNGSGSPEISWDLTNGTGRRFLYAIFEGAIAPPPTPTPGEEVTFPIRCVRRSPTVSSDGKRIRHVRLELDCMVGQGNADSPAPIMTLRTSDDNGSTWSSNRESSLGPVGAYRQKVKWYQLGAAYNRTYELVFTDAVDICIVQAWLDLEGWDH